MKFVNIVLSGWYMYFALHWLKELHTDMGASPPLIVLHALLYVRERRTAGRFPRGAR